MSEEYKAGDFHNISIKVIFIYLQNFQAQS